MQNNDVVTYPFMEFTFERFEQNEDSRNHIWKRIRTIVIHAKSYIQAQSILEKGVVNADNFWLHNCTYLGEYCDGYQGIKDEQCNPI